MCRLSRDFSNKATGCCVTSVTVRLRKTVSCGCALRPPQPSLPPTIHAVVPAKGGGQDGERAKCCHGRRVTLCPTRQAFGVGLAEAAEIASNNKQLESQLEFSPCRWRQTLGEMWSLRCRQRRQTLGEMSLRCRKLSAKSGLSGVGSEKLFGQGRRRKPLWVGGKT